MSDYFWILQLGCDLLFGMGLVWLWYRYRRGREEARRVMLQFVGEYGVRLERQGREYLTKMEAKLKNLARICTIAEQALKPSVPTGREGAPKAADDPSTKTEEEKELLSLVQIRSESTIIPTVDELQKTKQRLQKEVSVDLRTLLREQLS